jgi:cation transporter-like permease
VREHKPLINRTTLVGKVTGSLRKLMTRVHLGRYLEHAHIHIVTPEVIAGVVAAVCVLLIMKLGRWVFTLFCMVVAGGIVWLSWTHLHLPFLITEVAVTVVFAFCAFVAILARLRPHPNRRSGRRSGRSGRRRGRRAHSF